MVSSAASSKCANCSATTNLKCCAKCQDEWYCSRSCQKAHWKLHKKSCNSKDKPTPSSSSPSTYKPTASKNLSKTIDKPFHKLDAGTWLHDRSEKDVFKLLIDAFRLRCTDEYTFENKTTKGTVQAGGPNSKPAFQQFLLLAESKTGILPSWWSRDKTEKCVAFGMDSGDWSDLHRAVEKQDIINHYGESLMPMQMRMFYEKTSGRGLMGQSCNGMLQMQKREESGTLGMYSSMLDLGDAAKAFRSFGA
ncbi:hypothetical protein KCU65_g544, partial [Aureobasidium melanogenum]